MNTLIGDLSITRLSTDTVSIQVNDEVSGTRVIDVRVPVEDFARALMGLNGVGCTFSLLSRVVGKRRELKELFVVVPDSGFNKESRKRVAAEAVRPFEVDGWKASLDDALNHHRVVRWEDNGKVVRVRFTRFVEETND